MLHIYIFVVYIVLMSIVVWMEIRQHEKMGLSCRFDAFERNATAPIRPPYCLKRVK